MYSIADYGAMIADEKRMEAYTAALRRAVRPDSVVLDVGAGTGIFALLALSFGARRAYAVEPSDAVEVARRIAAANGYGDRLTVIGKRSQDVVLPERASVVVSDLRGTLPLFQHHLPAIADIRRRLLAPGGELIPRGDTIRVAVVEAPDLYERCTGPWEKDIHGIDMSPARSIAVNAPLADRSSSREVLLEAKEWAEIDYTSVTDPDFAGTLYWKVHTPGTGRGILVWFDADLGDGISLTNAPDAEKLIYGRLFFPWSSPVALERDDEVTLFLAADLVGDDYMWRWDTRVVSGGEGVLKADWRQSTFFGEPLLPAKLRKQSENYLPALGIEGQITFFVLDRMKGESSVGEIAAELRERFPDRFPTSANALSRVGDLSRRFT
jgi:protein arginine N-methyltransferase 1